MARRSECPEPIKVGNGLYFQISRSGEINPRSAMNLSVAIERLRLHGVKMELANAIIQECYGFAPKQEVWDLYYKYRDGWARVALWNVKQNKLAHIAEVTL